MLNVFAPAVALMNRFNYRAKFTLIGFLLIVTIAMLLGSLANNLLQTIELSRKELAALELLRPVYKQVQATQQHRGLSAGVLGGNAAMKDKQGAKQAEVDAAVSAVGEAEARLRPMLDVAAEWSVIRQEWEGLRGAGMSLSAADNLAAHSALIERVLRHQSQIADAGVLTGDPDLDTYYLIQTMLNRLPEMLERLGRLRAKGTGVLARKTLSQEERTEFSVQVFILQRALDGLSVDLGKAAKASPQLAERLNRFSGEITVATGDVIKTINEEILSEKFSIAPQAYFDKVTGAIDGGYVQLFDTLMPTLEGQIQARIRDLQLQLALEAGLSALIALSMAYLSIGVYFSVTAAVRRLVEATRAMAGGDLTVKVVLDSQDELSLVADSLNQMGASFNDLLRKVQQTAGSVSTAATELAGSSARVSASSQEQSGAAMSMAAAVEELTVSIDNIAEHAGSAEKTSSQSGGLSLESARIVEGTVDEMQQIAGTVNQSAGIIEELGRNTDRISAIIGVIKEIADQTNLLALNAAIEAARAGEQGRGFAVVADEVRKLAERTSQSTLEIGGMIQTIQSGTENAVLSMKGGVERVAQGMAMSQQAGVSIGKVRDGADQVLRAVSDISAALREQSSASNDIARNVERIAQMSEENSAAVATVAATANQLERLSGSLFEEVRRFRVS